MLVTAPPRNAWEAPIEEFLSDDSVSRYLTILGVARRDPSLEALSEIVAAHLFRIPFENVSMLFRLERFGMTRVPPLEMFLDDIEYNSFGGMCFSSNIHFYCLLKTIGYDARLCGAAIHVPDAHMVVVIDLDGRDYLIDVGYGAPFSRPMPLDLASDFRIELDHAFYRLAPRDGLGQSRMEFVQNGVCRNYYVVNPTPRTIRDFDQAIESLFAPRAAFRCLLLMARFWPGRFRIIHNLTVMDSDGTFRVHTLANRGELVGCVEGTFGISMATMAEVCDAFHLT
jgi:arylamine N-acetyltransferase